MDSDRGGLSPHRRRHRGVESAEEPESAVEVVQSPAETRIEAKRLLWRDSAIILVGIVLALLVVQFLPRSDPGLAADMTAAASGSGADASLAPGGPADPGATLGPIVGPSLGIDATQRPIPAITLPPTGSFEPGATDAPTPRPSKKPPATIAPSTPPPTPSSTPEATPPPTEPPPTEPLPTDLPTEEPTQPT